MEKQRTPDLSRSDGPALGAGEMSEEGLERGADPGATGLRRFLARRRKALAGLLTNVAVAVALKLGLDLDDEDAVLLGGLAAAFIVERIPNAD